MDVADRWRTAGLAAVMVGLFAAGPAVGVDRGAVAALGALLVWVWADQRR